MSHNFEISILGNLFFIFFWLAYKVQEYLSKGFFILFINPALLIAKLFNVERGLPDKKKRTDNKSFVVLNTLIWYHNLLLKYLNATFKVNSIISGVRHRFNIYEHILNWNKQIPLIGFEEDRTTFIIETLLGKSENGFQSVDFISLATHNKCGKFIVISKEVPDNKDEIEIKAVWLTGKERGKVFNVSNSFPYYYDLETKSYEKPSSIYYPPKWVVIIIELFLSASAVMAFFQLTKSSWKLIIPSLTKFYNQIFENLLNIIKSLI